MACDGTASKMCIRDSNYCLEVEQFGRCIKNGEVPYLTEKFSVDMADTVDEILKQIGY